jgi:hypothetical protein
LLVLREAQTMTRRTLLTMFAVGPLARLLPAPVAPRVTVADVSRIFNVPAHMLGAHISRELIEVTAFGDTNKIWVPRIPR